LHHVLSVLAVRNKGLIQILIEKVKLPVFGQTASFRKEEKEEEVETDLGEESLLSKPAPHQGRVGEGLPSLPLAAGPPTYKGRGRAPLSTHD